MIALCEIQRPIVPESLEVRFKPQLRIVRRSLRRAVEVNVELNLKATNVIFNTCQLVFYGWFKFDAGSAHALTPLLRQPGQFILAFRQPEFSSRGASRVAALNSSLGAGLTSCQWFFSN